MSLHRLNALVLVFTAVLIGVVNLWPDLLTYSDWFFLTVLLLAGIPHGAADHIIHWKELEVPSRQKRRFILRYLGLISGFGVFWLLAPSLAFGTFLLISAFHFGQSQLFFLKLPAGMRHLVFLSWGVLVLSVMTFFNYRECLEIFGSLVQVNTASWLSIPVLLLLISLSSVVCLLGFIFNRQRIPWFVILTEVLCILLLTISAIFTNVVFTFTIYFGIWHSMRSLVFEYRDIRHLLPGVGSFIRTLLPFTFLALLGMGFSYLILTLFFPGISPYMLFIILISGLTLPHLIIMDEVYENTSY